MADDEVIEGEVVDEDDDSWPEEWPHWAPGAIEAMRRVPSLTRAAETVGVNRSTVQRLAQRDQRFAAAMAASREEALDTLEEVCLLRGRTGQPVRKTVTKTYPNKEGVMVVETTVTEDVHISDNLAMFYLKRWRQEYRDSYRFEHTGDGGGPIEISAEEAMREAVDWFNGAVARAALTAGEGEVSDGGGEAGGADG